MYEDGLSPIVVCNRPDGRQEKLMATFQRPVDEVMEGVSPIPDSSRDRLSQRLMPARGTSGSIQGRVCASHFHAWRVYRHGGRPNREEVVRLVPSTQVAEKRTCCSRLDRRHGPRACMRELDARNMPVVQSDITAQAVHVGDLDAAPLPMMPQ